MDIEQQNLNAMLDDMEQAPDRYKPTNFWNSGLESIVSDLREKGFANFREHDSALVFYVPTFVKPLWTRRQSILSPVFNLTPKKVGLRLRHWFDGQSQFEMEYRLFRAADTNQGLSLKNFSEEGIGGGEFFKPENQLFSKSSLNYLRALTFLKKSTDTSDLRSILEIGGGYGTLGEILLKARDDSFYMNVDIPPVAAVSTYYLSKIFGEDKVLRYSDSRDLTEIDVDEIKSKYRAAVLCPWQLPKVKGQFDLFANFISFQEMEPDVVKNYIDLVQPLTKKHALIRNSRHGKNVAEKEGTMGVFEPVSTDFIVKNFDQFDLQARDALVYGEVSYDKAFHSEVLVFSRKQN